MNKLKQAFEAFDFQTSGKWIDSPAHRGDFIVDVLEGLKVLDVFHSTEGQLQIHESETLDEIVHRLPGNRQHFFPVVDSDGNVKGVFTSDDVREYLYKDDIWQLAIASDVMRVDFPSVSPNDDLNTALRRITERHLDELPVLDATNGTKLLGLLSRRDIISAYNNRLAAHRKAAL